MNIKIQIGKDLVENNVIGAYVYDEINVDEVIGTIVSYDKKTGIAICELF